MRLRISRPAVGAVVLFMASAAGCGGGTALEDAGLSLAPPEGWRPVDPTESLVTGKPLAAWTGPEGMSLVVFRELWAPGATASSLAEGLANRWVNLPGLEVEACRVATIDGRPAARVDAVAPGDGRSWAPTGTGQAVLPGGATPVPTRRVAVGVPGRKGVVWLWWQGPEAASAIGLPQVDATLATLKLGPDFEAAAPASPPTEPSNSYTSSR